MREGSQAEHTEAEASSFMAELLAGRVNKRGYAALYIAHHYTRYLGDLSGGQAIGRMPYKDAYRR